jgi:hypothetical protein
MTSRLVSKIFGIDEGDLADRPPLNSGDVKVSINALTPVSEPIYATV